MPSRTDTQQMKAILMANAPASKRSQKAAGSQETPDVPDLARHDVKVKRPSAQDRILQAALDEFARCGFDGTTTRNIAKIAGVTPPLVLYHFESKDKLWLAAVSRALDDYLRFVRDEIGNDPNESAKNDLSKFIRYFIEFSVEYPQIHRIMSTQEQDSERLHWLVDGYLRDYFNKIRDLIKKGQLEGSVRDGDPARIFYQIIGSGTLFSISTEYKLLTGKDITSESEIHYTMAFIFALIFT